MVPFRSALNRSAVSRFAVSLIAVLLVFPGVSASAESSDGAERVDGPSPQFRFVSAYASATTLEELQFAPDFTSDHANLLRLYQAFFNREPDLGGARYWMQEWDRLFAAPPSPQRPEGHDLLGEFAGYFAGSAEFLNRYGNIDNAAFLNAVYVNMLDRAPDPGGYDYWLSFLEGTNAEQPGVFLSRGSTVRWVTRNDEFVQRYPFGHSDRSPHPSDSADCTLQNLTAFRFQTITAVYRIRDGVLRELCFGTRDTVVEDAWNRLTEVSDPNHHSPVALLAVFEGTGSGILAYAGPSTVNGSFGPDVWKIGAQDLYFQSSTQNADLTMIHEMSHVFTQTADQIDTTTGRTDARGRVLPPECPSSVNAFERYCFTADAILTAWVQQFWSPDELAVWETRIDDDRTNDIPSTNLCVPGHDFAGSYATTSPYEDLAEAFAAYVYGVERANLAQKYAFFDARPVLKAYRTRAIAAGRTGYADPYDTCVPLN